MTDEDLKILYRWSREELRNGNRIKASKIHKIYDKFREIRGDTSWNNGKVAHIDCFDELLVLEELANQTRIKIDKIYLDYLTHNPQGENYDLEE